MSFKTFCLACSALGALTLSSSLVMADTTGLGRHKQLYAVPVPGAVTIDGKLADWDLSGQIEMFVVSEGKDTQGARFALMYDKEALYLSGVVRDTSPMMNRQDPKANGERGWDADSCQFRITLDPSRPYPETESVWQYRADSKLPDTRDDIKHLTMWHYTDRAEAVLGMQMGMSYRVPRPDMAPHGIVPAADFDGKYLKDEDNRGYTLEYRIPWKTLGAKAPLQGGNIVAGTVQFNWGRANGLSTAGGSAWAYDVMAGPGFVFQNAQVWGKVIFAEKGNVSQALVTAGVPTEKPLPLKFAYELPREGQITLQLFDDQNMVRRTLVAQGDRRQGPNVELWDGMDDQGKPLPAGNYAVKGIIHDPIKGEYVLSVHNSGSPAYPTDDGKGGWGGDHGNPVAASALADGLLLGWNGAEYGWGIIKVDNNGKKQWGIKSGANLLAHDGTRFYAYDPHGFQSASGIRAFEVVDGRPVNFGNGSPLIVAPPGGSKATDVVAGLAWQGGKVYVSYEKRNLIGIFDAASGNLEKSWEVPAPGHLGVRPDGTILAISAGGLVALPEGKVVPLNKTDLDEPQGIAVGKDGVIYVSNRGKRQDVAVLNAAGKLLRRIGKAGGRPAVGNYDRNGIYQPAGLAVDTANLLWVTEEADGPKRISVWSSNGKFDREFFGGSAYFGYAAMNPELPTEIYGHNMLWRVDWDKKTTTPISTIWRKTAPDMMDEPDPGAYPRGFQSFHAPNGKQYGWGVGSSDRKGILYRREGNIFKPFFATFGINRPNKWAPFKGLGSAELDDPANTPDGWYFWQDANDDQRVQLAELHRFKDKNSRLNLKAVAPDLTLWLDGGQVLKPASYTPAGQPIYDPEKLEKTFLTGTPHSAGYLWLDPQGGVYTHTSGQRPSLAKWSADGKMEWGYPSIVRWHDALGLPVVKAGRLHGMTGPLGVAGNFTGNMSYFGVVHLFQRDGIYTAAINRDGRAGGVGGSDVGQPEGQGGQMVQVVTKKGAKPRTFVLAGGQDGRVTEVLGLDTIRPLPASTLTLTGEEAQLAAAKLAEYNASIGQNTRLVILAEQRFLDSATSVKKDFDGARSFAVTAARDEKNLYVRYVVRSSSELINAMADPVLLFKGGNALDIQLATDKAADPQRKTPAPGDLRLLVSRRVEAPGQAPKPYAVLYRTKLQGFTGEPTVLKSPTGTEAFDSIQTLDNIGLTYRKTGDGFTALVTIPLDSIGLKLEKGQNLKMDVGYIYGNSTGSQVAARSYWTNNSFSANVVNDIPHESRLEPGQWGTAVVE